MSDRIHYLTVALEKDYRDDDTECIINAIKMISGVIDVTPHVVNGEHWVAEARLRREFVEHCLNFWEKK